MVIICLFICSKEGKVIFARQFISLFSKNEILVQSNIFIKNYFPKSSLNFFESSKYRYLYQMLNEKLILVLIVSILNSNILLEQQILKTCLRIIQQRIRNDINEENIKKEGINIAIDLEEVVSNGLVQNLQIGEINTKIQMLRIDKNEIKKLQEQKEIKEKSIMIRQFEEMEKLENYKNNELNYINNKSINLSEELSNKNRSLINNNHFQKSEEKKKISLDNSVPGNIRLNHKFELVKINKPIVFKTPSGKVVLLGEQQKPIESRKEKLIKGIKLK